MQKIKDTMIYPGSLTIREYSSPLTLCERFSTMSNLFTSLPPKPILQSSNISNTINKDNPLMIFTMCNKGTILPYSLSCFQQSWIARKSQQFEFLQVFEVVYQFLELIFSIK